jgi:hypothetical protein
VHLREFAAAVDDADEALRRGEPTPRTIYTAARTYALALQLAADSANVRDRLPTSPRRVNYENRALGLIRQALEKTPAAERARFWRDVVAADDVLRPLRPLRGFQQLLVLVGSPGH